MNRKYDKSAFLKSGGKLFHTLVAAAAKVVSSKQLEVRWTVSGMQLSCASVGDQLAHIGNASGGMPDEDR